MFFTRMNNIAYIVSIILSSLLFTLELGSKDYYMASVWGLISFLLALSFWKLTKKNDRGDGGTS